MAEELGRSPSTVADEVARNRSVSRGPNKGGRAGEPGAQPRLIVLAAASAEAIPLLQAGDASTRQPAGNGRRGCRRRAFDRGEAEFELIIRERRARAVAGADAASRAAQLSASTIYRWIERGYAGMSSLELQEVHKRRSPPAGPKATAHGEARSFGAFMGLPEEERAPPPARWTPWWANGGAC